MKLTKETVQEMKQPQSKNHKHNCDALFDEWQAFNLEARSLQDFRAGYLACLASEGKFPSRQLSKGDSSHLHRLARRNCHERLVSKLRQAGYKVHVKHWRYIEKNPKLTEVTTYKNHADFLGGLSANGGYTSVTLVFPDGSSFAASSRCSKKDNFRKRYGVGLALARCIEKSQRSNEVFKVLNTYPITLTDGED